MTARWFLMGCWVLTGAACAPSLSVGAPCVFNSDCPEPLNCLADRCRNECVTSRDCPLGLACVSLGEGFTGCRVPEDDLSCDGCGSPLVCLAGRCIQPCEDQLDCVAENVCSDGACAPAPGMTVGACNPLSPVSGCDEGICVRSADTFECASPPASVVALGMPCASNAMCGAGASCASGRCVRLCSPGTSSCGEGLLCRDGADLLGVAPGGSIGPQPPPGLGYCTEKCDPLAEGSGDCPEGTACSIGVTSGRQGFFFFCRSLISPALAVGETCDDANAERCPTGTLCAPVGASRACLAFCDPSLPVPCVEGTCTLIPLGGGRPFGECTPP